MPHTTIKRIKRDDMGGDSDDLAVEYNERRSQTRRTCKECLRKQYVIEVDKDVYWCRSCIMYQGKNDRRRGPKKIAEYANIVCRPHS